MKENEPARRVSFKGKVEFRREADELTSMPGDSVIVERGRPRSFVIACPDGCGEHLTINLDDRSGPAWRWYETNRGITLFPSVWRDSGCRVILLFGTARSYGATGTTKAIRSRRT